MLHIADKLAVPRFSRNGNLYFPEELAKFDGAKIDLRWMHMGEKASIGYSVTRFDKSEMNVYYDAYVTDAKAEAEIRKNPKKWKTSLGAKPLYDKEICHDGSGKCYRAPMGLTPIEMSIVDHPGIPEAGLSIIESETITMEGEIVVETPQCDKCVGTCLKNKKIMGKDPSNPQNQAICFSECPCKKEITSNQSILENHGMSETFDEAKERAALEAKIRTELEAKAKAESEKLAAEKTAAENAAKEAKAKEEALRTDLEKQIKEGVEAKVTELQKEISEKYVPKSAQITESAKTGYVEEGSDAQIAEMKKILTDSYARIEIDLEGWMKAHTEKSSTPIAEGVTTSGTIPGVKTMTDIVILPGSVSVKPIRQWCDFQIIPQGEDKVRFYTINIPAFGTITETVNTDITPATHTLTSIDVSADTPRGFRQVVKKTEIEKYPAVLLNKIRETARLRAIQDESNIVLTTAGSTANDFGTNHFSASDGVAVTTTTLEDAAGEFLHEGIEKAREYFMEKEHPTAPGDLVCALHPRAYRTLSVDPDLDKYVQQGIPSLSTLGRIEMFLGVELLVTNNLETQNNAWRNIIWVKGKAFAIASGRTLEIEFFKDINKQNVSIVATHRTGAGILDSTAYCILSSFKQ